MLSCKIIELIKVLRIAANDNRTVALFYVDYCFEHYPVAILDELTH